MRPRQASDERTRVRSPRRPELVSVTARTMAVAIAGSHQPRSLALNLIETGRCLFLQMLTFCSPYGVELRIHFDFGRAAESC